MPLDARRISQRCDILAGFSEHPDHLARVFMSPEQRDATAMVAAWMREAGMHVRIDAIGNVIGRYEGEREGLPCLMLGSHLDTVRDAGRYDGMLGVVAAIECVADLAARRRRLPCAIEVIGFSDEEGVRFSSTLLGSRAVTGRFDARVLDLVDASGVAMRDALAAAGFDAGRIGDAARRPEEVLAYVELHIEQGPVLEAEQLAVGVVTAINGGNRFWVEVAGMAGHAGTVPMRLRQDALAAAAECVLAVERIASSMADVVGTVGRIDARPGAMNVIPGSVRFSLDARAPTDALRREAVAAMTGVLAAIAVRRGCAMTIDPIWEGRTAPCDPALQEQLAAAMRAEGQREFRLPSGAGHDGMAMIDLAPIGMLFLRCTGGISHHPAEAVTLADLDVGARVLLRFIEHFSILTARPNPVVTEPRR
jgi:allantoate deiminase